MIKTIPMSIDFVGLARFVMSCPINRRDETIENIGDDWKYIKLNYEQHKAGAPTFIDKAGNIDIKAYNKLIK